MRRHPGLLMTLLIVLFSAASAAQAARWRSYVEADGLPSRVILDLVEGPDGAMWAATDQGLARLDRGQPAARWETLSTDVYVALAVSSAGVIWAGGSGTAIQWFDADGSALATPSALEAPDVQNVTALLAGDDGAVWAGYAFELRRWFETAGAWQSDHWPLAGTVRDLDRDASGTLWIGYQPAGGTAGLAVLDGSTVTALRLPGNSTGPDQVVGAVLALQGDQVIVGTDSGRAYHYARATGVFSTDIFAGDVPARPSVADLTFDAFGRLWIARKEAHRFDVGADVSDPSGWTRTILAADQGLNGDRLTVITESSAFVGTGLAPVGAREMWFGNDQGVSVQSGLPWSNYRVETGGLTGDLCANNDCNVVTAIAIDATGQALWFGARWGLSRRDAQGSWSAWTNGLLPGTGPPILTHPTIRALHVDPDGGLWLANGTQTATTSAVQYHAAGADDLDWQTVGSGADRWRVAALARDEAGFLWLAAGDGAWRLDTTTSPPEEMHFDASDGLPQAPLDALTTGAGFVFVASAEGVGRYDLERGTWTLWPFAALGTSAPAAVRGLLEVAGRVYIATDAGLIVSDVDASSLAGATVLSAASGLPGGFANDLYDLADGGNGTVLVAASTGLYRVSASLDRTGRMTVLDGLPEDDLRSVENLGDEVWTGTNGDGAAGHLFEPPETAIVEPPADVVTSSTNPIVVVVAGADPDSPVEHLQYQLRVDDRAWQEPLPGPNVSFVPFDLALEDGDHVVEVRALDNGLLADQTPAVARFELDTAPPVPWITSPASGGPARGTAEIQGTADDEDGRFDRYRVTARLVRDPQADTIEILPWTPTPVVDGTLALWDTRPLPDDWYRLEVVVRDQLGVQGSSRIDVLVDNRAPFADVTSPVRVRGETGATVYSAAGDAALSLPPFAFEGETWITVDREPADAIGGYGFRVGPGELALRKRATIRIQVPTDPTPIANPPEQWSVHRHDGARWVALGGTLERGSPEDPRPATFSVAVDAFGLYALRLPSEPLTGSTVISALSAEPRHFRPRSGAVEQMSVSFVLGRPTAVTAMVYNRAGRARRVLAQGQTLGAGEQVLYWDGKDEDGEMVASALYILCVEAAGERVTQVVTVGSD